MLKYFATYDNDVTVTTSYFIEANNAIEFTT